MARRIRRPSGPLDLRSSGDPPGRHRGIRQHRSAGRLSALVERYRLGVSSATVRSILAELEVDGFLDASPHERRARPHRRRLPLLRDLDGRGVALPPGRAAHDPPPVRPGRVRERALVPPRGDDARHGHHARPGSPRRPSRAPRASAGSTSSRSTTASRASSSCSARAPSSRCWSRSTRPRPGRPDLGRGRHLNDLLGGPRRPRRIDARSPGSDAGRSRAGAASPRVGERVVRRDARVRCRGGRGCLQRRPAQRDGRARNSPRATSSGASSRPSRTAPTWASSSGRVAGVGPASSVFIGEREPSGRDARRVARPRAVRPSPAARSGSSASSGPTRMAYPHAIGTVRFVSRPDGRARRPPLRLTHDAGAPAPARAGRSTTEQHAMTHRKTRAQRAHRASSTSRRRERWPRHRGR